MELRFPPLSSADLEEIRTLPLHTEIFGRILGEYLEADGVFKKYEKDVIIAEFKASNICYLMHYPIGGGIPCEELFYQALQSLASGYDYSEFIKLSLGTHYKGVTLKSGKILSDIINQAADAYASMYDLSKNYNVVMECSGIQTSPGTAANPNAYYYTTCLDTEGVFSVKLRHPREDEQPENGIIHVKAYEKDTSNGISFDITCDSGNPCITIKTHADVYNILKDNEIIIETVTGLGKKSSTSLFVEQYQGIK